VHGELVNGIGHYGSENMSWTIKAILNDRDLHDEKAQRLSDERGQIRDENGKELCNHTFKDKKCTKCGYRTGAPQGNK